MGNPKYLVVITFLCLTNVNVTFAGANAKNQFDAAKATFDQGTVPLITEEESAYAGNCYADPSDVSKETQKRSSNPHAFSSKGTSTWLAIKKVETNVEMALVAIPGYDSQKWYQSIKLSDLFQVPSVQGVLAESITQSDGRSLIMHIPADGYQAGGIAITQEFRTYNGQLVSRSLADPEKGGLPMMCYWFKLLKN